MSIPQAAADNDLVALVAALQIVASAEERVQEQEATVVVAVERWASVVDAGVQHLLAHIAEMNARLDVSEQTVERAIRKSNAAQIKEVAAQVLATQEQMKKLTAETEANRIEISRIGK